ncbi:diaminopimelate epimerase [Lentibacillus sp. CBA3610]|nr:diaminopimelate epimerase [Lentibacillus sp. CBA3610]
MGSAFSLYLEVREMPAQLSFTKMHGLGNSYIYVNGFEQALSEKRLPELAQNVSDPNTGIGADGLVIMAPSETAEVKMRIFNKDGSEAKNCGNALRCVAKYVYEKGMVKNTTFHIETLSGLVRVNVHVVNGTVDEVTVDMGTPKLKSSDLPMTGGTTEKDLVGVPIEVDGNTVLMTGVSMGNPHGVFFVDDIEEAPVKSYGPVLSDHHRLFPEGLNVEFVQVVNSHELQFRVWERGSGITRACGTGACAAVVAAVLNNYVKQGKEVTVHLLGGDMKILWANEGSVYMRGPAVTICEGLYLMGV